MLESKWSPKPGVKLAASKTELLLKNMVWMKSTCQEGIIKIQIQIAFTSKHAIHRGPRPTAWLEMTQTQQPVIKHEPLRTPLKTVFGSY